MIIVVISGLVVANLMIDTNYAGLVATTYGWLLITKLTLLAVILSIASRAKSVWVPALNLSPDMAAVGGQKLQTWVRIEFGLAILLVIVATVLANAVPELAEKLIAFRKRQEETVLGMTLPEVE